MKLDIPLLRRLSTRRSSLRPPQGKAELTEALRRAESTGELTRAIVCCRQLEVLEPAEPRWHRRHAELLRRAGRGRDAARAYRTAATLYERGGLVRQAAALTRLAHGLDPSAITCDKGTHPMLLESFPIAEG